MNKALAAGVTSRYALAASYFGRAAALATQLHGDTLLAAHLKLQQANKVYSQASVKGMPADEALVLESAAWEIVSGVLPLLLRRLDANTLLPGRCTKEEVDYYRRFDEALGTTLRSPAMSAHEVTLLSFAVGFATILQAAHLTVSHFYGSRVPLSVDARRAAEAFVSNVIDLMLPASRSLGTVLGDAEKRFTGLMSIFVDHPSLQADAFIVSLRAKWKAPAMVAMRAERGLEMTRLNNEVDAAAVRGATKRAADIAEHGLKTCAFPPCDKREATVMQYKSCSACR